MDIKTLLILVKNDIESEFIHFLIDNKFHVPIIHLNETSTSQEITSVFILNISSGNSHDNFVKWIEQNLDQPIIIIDQGDYNWEQFQISEQVSKHTLESSYQEIANIINAFELPSKHNDEADDYSAVSITNLQIFDALNSDVYIKLRTGRKLKIFSRGDSLTHEDIKKYKNRGVDTLYFSTEKLNNTIKFIEENISSIQINKPITLPENEELKTHRQEGETIDQLLEDPSLSGTVDSQANRLKKEFDKKKQIQPIQTKNEEKPTAVTTDATIDDLIKQPIAFNYPFILDKAKLITLKQVSNDIISTSINSPLIKDYFLNLMETKDSFEYVKKRIGIITNILTGISTELEWGTKTVIERFIYAAMIHDIALFDRFDLIKLQFEEELEELSKSDKDFFYLHPEAAAQIAKEDRYAPPNVDSILEQHHERLDGSGFPKNLNKHKINPYSAAFIMSINFAQYILNFEKWNINEYLLLIDTEFKGGNFIKPLNALENLCKNNINKK